MKSSDMNMVKLFPLIVIFLLVSLNALGLDTTGVKDKLSKCYELNKLRDVKLITNSKGLLPVAKSYPNSDLAVRIYTLVGRGFMNNFQYDSCTKYYNLAEQNLSGKVTSDAKGKLMIAKGWSLFQTGNENKALNVYLKAYDYFVEAKDSLSLAGVLGNMATLVDALNQYDKGLIYKQKALAIYKLKNDTLGILQCLNNIGSNYMNRGDFKLAISYLNQSIKFGEKKNFSRLLISIYANLGNCYLNVNQLNEAEKIGDVIIKMNLKSGGTLEVGKAYLFKALACDNRNEGNLTLAFADSSYKYLLIDQNIQTKSISYKALVQLYSKYKIFDKALEASLKRDSLLNSETESGLALAFAKTENNFQLESSKAEVESLKSLSESQAKQVQSQRQIIGLIIGIVIVFISAFLLTFYLFRKSKLAEKAIQVQNLVVEKQNQELKKQNELQLMTIGIVGHDLRGPLASALTLKQIMVAMLQAGQIDECIHLAKLHFDSLERIHSLANNLVQWVLSAQSGINLNFSELYVIDLIHEVLLNFETVLKDKNIEVVLDFHPSCKVYADLSSVQTILRNIIQNAIKFTPENKKITIMAHSSHWTPDIMYIFIQDEGKGIAPDILEKINAGKKVVTNGTRGEKGNGLGLIVIQTLLSLNNGRMSIESEVGKGTKFHIDLPISESNQ